MNTVEFLKEIHRVMEEVRDLGKEIYMQGYYKDDSIVDYRMGIPACTSPACVAGWCALDEKIQCILYESGLSSMEAHNVWRYMEELVKKDLNDGYLGSRIPYSLFRGYFNLREFYFEHCFPHRDRSNIAHLNKDNPTPQDVIDFINILIEELQELKK